MTKVIGYERKRGEYNGTSYDNMNLYTISNDLPNVTGYYPNTIKIKWNQLCQIFDYSGAELPTFLENIINSSVAIDMAYVGRYPQLIRIRNLES